MTLILKRNKDNGVSTIGELSIDGKFFCYTLEDVYRKEKVYGETRIPAGTYKIGLTNSPKFSKRYGHYMLTLKDVPNFERILIHKGNTAKDTAGCILVGAKVQGDEIEKGTSTPAYNSLYKVVYDSVLFGDLSITIIDKEEKEEGVEKEESVEKEDGVEKEEGAEKEESVEKEDGAEKKERAKVEKKRKE